MTHESLGEEGLNDGVVDSTEVVLDPADSGNARRRRRGGRKRMGRERGQGHELPGLRTLLRADIEASNVVGDSNNFRRWRRR